MALLACHQVRAGSSACLYGSGDGRRRPAGICTNRLSFVPMGAGFHQPGGGPARSGRAEEGPLDRPTVVALFSSSARDSWFT